MMSPRRRLTTRQPQQQAGKDREDLAFRFIADVAHRLRTPLSVLTVHSTLLTTGRPELQDHVNAIQRATTQLEHAVADLVAEMRRVTPGAEHATARWLALGSDDGPAIDTVQSSTDR